MLKKILFLFLLFSSIQLHSTPTTNHQELENKIKTLNDNLKFEESIKILMDIVNNNSSSYYDKYFAYLLKSYTYKRVFNYTKALHFLDLALQEGLKSDKKEIVKAIITAEKCFIYFDTQDYEKAEKLINQLRKNNFKHLPISSKSWIVMQDGYIKMLNKDYTGSEKLLDEAIALVNINSPENLPNIYGKKIELYNKMKLYKKRDDSFKKGVKLAKKHNKIKYEMYLYQVMRNIYQENEDYKNAFYTQKKYDSIVKFYNATEASSKIELTEKKLEEENEKLLAENKKYIDYILYCIITSLSLLLLFAMRLYQTNKTKRRLVEKENTRIHNEIERLTLALDKKGNTSLNLSNFDLTDRQKEIIEHIRSGLTNKEIANKLFISENTVKYHLKIIYEILNVEHRSAIR